MRRIVTGIYHLIITMICIFILYLAHSIEVDIIRGITLNFFCLILILLFRSYSLFYASLAVMMLTAYGYYHKAREKIDFRELVKIFSMSIINITISVFTLFKIIHYYPNKKAVFIEITPIIYIAIIYIIIIILILSFNNYLSMESKNAVHSSIVQTTALIISIVLLIIIVNAAIYCIIHNYPLKQNYGIFDGNFLKDPIQSNYKSAKAFADCLWFSATTFFTVGYGDMHPVGNIMYLFSMMEMISAYVLGIIIIPILLFKASYK